MCARHGHGARAQPHPHDVHPHVRVARAWRARVQVLIDEAAQAVEMSTLIPLKYHCRRLILVGDPSQLPATVFSEHAMRHNYEQSLFQRLQVGGQRVAMLTTQYRMHPSISRFPGRKFYDGALRDAPGMVQSCAAPWHARRWLGPYAFYDVAEGVASEVSLSWCNDLEAKLAIAIVKHLLDEFGQAIKPSAIGIISPYNGQVRHLRRLLAEHLPPEAAGKVEVNSVDGFQGREKEVILLSCVRSDRARPARGIGFLRDARRMNVSITRAKHSVLLLGHADTLGLDPLWAAALQDAQDRECLVRATGPITQWFGKAVRESALAADAEDADDVAAPMATGEAATQAVVRQASDASPSAARIRKRAAKALSASQNAPS